jgi:hypothetical protein
MPLLTPADLKKTIYIAKEYNPGSSKYAGPALKDASGKIGTAESKRTHFMVASGLRYSAKLVDEPKQQKSKWLRFGPPNDGDEGVENAAVLPFLPNNISSVVVPRKSVDYFFTDGLSGCAIFIDVLPNEDLVLYHANAAEFSPTPEETRDDPAFETKKAVATMKDYHEKARKAAYKDAKPAVALFKSQYNSAGKAFLERARKALKRTDAEFWGGTNVMGFRVGSGWEFYYQTYASLSNGGTRDIIAAEKFWW